METSGTAAAEGGVPGTAVAPTAEMAIQFGEMSLTGNQGSAEHELVLDPTVVKSVKEPDITSVVADDLGRPEVAAFQPSQSGSGVGIPPSAAGSTGELPPREASAGENMAAAGTGERPPRRPRPEPHLPMSRSIFVGSLKMGPGVAPELLLLANSFGPVESVKIQYHSGIAFLNFVKQSDAEAFYECCSETPPFIGQHTAFVNTAKPPPLEPWVQEAIAQGATRNLFMANYGPARLDEVRSMFSQFCQVLDIIVKDTYAFVHTTSVIGAMEAKRHLEGAYVGGKPIVLNFAVEKGMRRDPGKLPFLFSKPHWPFRASGAMHPRPFVATRNLHVAGYGPETSVEDIRSAFAPQCEVLEVAMKNGYCFVHTNSVQSAMAAKRFFERPFILKGRAIKVNFARDRGDAGSVQRETPTEVSQNLHVSGYPPTTTKEQIMVFFGEQCEVTDVVMKYGYCFVHTTDPETATAAKEQLQGANLNGANITVNYALDRFSGRQRQPFNPHSWSPFGADDGDMVIGHNMSHLSPTTELHVSHFGPGTTQEQIMSLFGEHCRVRSVVMKHSHCFVNTVSIDDAVKAKTATQGKTVNGDAIRVKFARDRGPHHHAATAVMMNPGNSFQGMAYNSMQGSLDPAGFPMPFNQGYMVQHPPGPRMHRNPPMGPPAMGGMMPHMAYPAQYAPMQARGPPPRGSTD